MDYPYNLSKEEVIRRITQVYHAGYDLTSETFDVYDQLLACEAIDESQKEYEERKNNNPSESVSVSGSVNDIYKRRVNFELTPNKLQVISNLKGCDYKTSRFEISQLLEEFFEECESKEGHWLYVAQTYSPRVINWNLNYMIKAHSSGRRTFQNWAAYFTESIKFRKKRKESRAINDTR